MGISTLILAGTLLAASSTSAGSTLDLHVSTTSDRVQVQITTNLRGGLQANVHWNNGDVTSHARITVGQAIITFEKPSGQPATVGVSGLSLLPNRGSQVASTDQRLLASTADMSTPPAAGFLDGLASVGTSVLDELALWVRTIVPFLLLGLVLMLLLPRLAAEVRGTAMARPWGRLGIGAVFVIALPSAAVGLLVAGFFLGIWWLGLLLLALYGVALAAGYTFSGMVMGRTIADRLGWSGLPMFWALLGGLAVLSLLTLVPYLGAVVVIGAVCYGLGSLVLVPRTPESGALPRRFVGTRRAPRLQSTESAPTTVAGAPD